jgi:acyl carrier protein
MTVVAPVVTANQLTRLQQVFTAALELAPDVDHSGLAYRETPQWDSVAHLQLVIALEAEFDVMLETDDVLSLSSFGDATTILGRHGIAF